MSVIRERWKDIKGHDGFYQISNYGRLKSFKHNKITGRIRKWSKNEFGYYFTQLSKNSKPQRVMAAPLVGKHFIKNPFNKPYINHKDEIKTNNYYKNLEWVTDKENKRYSSTLNDKKVNRIRTLYKSGKYTQEDLAAIYKFDRSYISYIVNYKNWV